MEDAEKLIVAVSEFIAAASVLATVANKLLANAPPQWKPWTDGLSRILNFLAVNVFPRAHDKGDKLP